MTKQDIISRLTTLSGLKRKNVLFIINNFLDIILKSTNNNEKVLIRGFGSFYNTLKKERDIYSPITGKYQKVPAKTVLSFKASNTTKKELL